MRNALILHGTDGHSKENWFDWLREELEKKDWKVWVPDLPQADKPNIERYNKFIFSNKDWKFDENSILIGHSSGAVAILGLLQVLPENVRIDTCYLVGSFKDDLCWEALEDLFIVPFDFDAIKKKAKRFIFIHSDNDPYCPLDHAKFLSQKLDGKLIIREGQKHFSIGSYGEEYKQFPFLLDLIEKNKTTTKL
ncbi:alpha/beta hydrolase [Patescibacteria group bacterium]|nr:alpha/beta hydrolase [Patescibacteria group bacterium]MBU1886077.1 alpha/beta hydrolase [Patescibacteria group bacterium]